MTFEIRKKSFWWLVIIIFGLSVFSLAKAALEVPPQVCGDGITQSPNDNGEFEKCDDGTGSGENPVPVETERCTAACGVKMLGWAWSPNFGWLSLGCGNTGTCETVKYFGQIAADNQILGWAWSNLIGWVCFGSTCQLFGGQTPVGGWTAYVEPDGSETPPVKGWAKILALGDSGWLSLSCENAEPGNDCLVSNYQVSSILENFDSEPRLTLNGPAWNNAAGGGIGWVVFNPDITEILPWLQTQYGDIYARRGIAGQAPPSFNATYRILSSGDIVNFYSARGTAYIDPSFGPIDFPTVETRYSNVLGQLDVDRLLCEGVTKASPDETCINSQGKTVVSLNKRITPPTTCLSQPCVDNPLAGKIYYYKGDLVISNNFDFLNGSDFASGAGTIIVDGNLTVTADDITYDRSDNLTKFRNLASVAWIVRGDLLIQGNVSQLAGNFIVIGDGASNCEAAIEVPGCGQIYSCYNSANCQNRLTVSGLLMGRKFYLAREFFPGDPLKGQKGSEVVIYDGRLLANVPPGLGDLAKSLPIWRSGVFSP